MHIVNINVDICMWPPVSPVTISHVKAAGAAALGSDFMPVQREVQNNAE